MVGIEITSRVDTSGPLFDARAQRYANQFADEVEEEIAEEAEYRLQVELKQVLRHPTGYYQSRVRARPMGALWQVTDGGVVYGPWLEGTGSRNRTTRFKGYFHWRRVGSSINRDAPDIARRMLPRLAGRLS